MIGWELSAPAVAAFVQVVLIDLVLAADNAIVVGALAAGLPPQERRRVIAIGIAAAFVLRIGFALLAVRLLAVVGLVLAGGLLLLWVAWKMWRELNAHPENTAVAEPRPVTSFAAAAWSVAVADISMSLDNVLAVAGAAREHPLVMVAGLVLSVAFMGFAADLVSRYITRMRWLGYAGLAVVVYVALRMIVDGWRQVSAVVA